MEKSQNRKPFQALRDLFHPVDLTHGTCWRTILQFSLPVILSYLLQQVYTISDAAIVGQTLTAQEVAGVNDTTSLVFIFLQFAFGVSAGFCVITSCCVGCRDQAGVRRSMAAQLVLSAGLTVLLTALALVLLNPMLAWINVTPENPEVYRAAYTYCGIIFAGIGAQLFYNFICSFLRSMGDSVTPLLFLLGSTVLNVALDLLFILVLRWGVAGAAGATVTAQLISTVACFAYAFSKYPDLRLHKEDWHITGLDLKRHIVQGVPLGLQFSVLAIGIIVMQSVVVKFDMIDGQMVSHAAQNGFGAANKLNSLIMTPGERPWRRHDQLHRPESGCRVHPPHPQGHPAGSGHGRHHRRLLRRAGSAPDHRRRISPHLPQRRQGHRRHHPLRQPLPVCGLLHVPAAVLPVRGPQLRAGHPASPLRAVGRSIRADRPCGHLPDPPGPAVRRRGQRPVP